MSPAELEALQRGDQQRWNRIAWLVAWALAQLRVLMQNAVTNAIGPIFDKDYNPAPPTTPKELVKHVPFYEDEDE